jgi:hypothetical protein
MQSSFIVFLSNNQWYFLIILFFAGIGIVNTLFAIADAIQEIIMNRFIKFMILYYPETKGRYGILMGELTDGNDTGNKYMDVYVQAVKSNNKDVMLAALRKNIKNCEYKIDDCRLTMHCMYCPFMKHIEKNDLE